MDYHNGLGHRPQRDYPSNHGDAMTGLEVRTLVVDHQVVEVELETDDRPRSMGLSIRVDGAKRWSSEEPGWRDVACGVADMEVFVWSARRLVVAPLKPGTEAYGLDSDEDILIVFPVDNGWLLVCETSVRLVIDGTERSRLELPDVVGEARWDGERLRVRCGDGSGTSVVGRSR